MARKLTPSQMRSKLRSIDRKNRQAIAKANRTIDSYNREARRNNRRLAIELNRLGSRRVTIRFVSYRTSLQTLQHSFSRVETAYGQGALRASDEVLDLAEGETANSVAVLNALLDDPTADNTDTAQLQQTVITTELLSIDPELHARWQGALYSLSPNNPDAARHFCTSTREIFVRILDLKAPDAQVLAAYPDIKKTESGQVLRREKIRYGLNLCDQQDDEILDFVENDIDNVMELFAAFNPATHGEAGRYDLAQLGAIKTRVEGAIHFLHRMFNC